MSILFECPNCGQTYDAGEHLAGKGMRCRSCQALMRVPDPPPARTPNALKPEPAPNPLPPRFSPPDDTTPDHSDPDIPFALAAADPSIPLPIQPENPPPLLPAPNPAAPRPAPLPRLTFGSPPTSTTPPEPPGSSPHRSTRSSSITPSPSLDREPWAADSRQLLKLGAAALFALVSLLAVARLVFFSGSSATPEETIVLDSGPDFSPSPPTPRPQPGSPSFSPPAPPARSLSPATPPPPDPSIPGF